MPNVRFGAKLLFQFRRENEIKDKKRVVETRIVIIDAADAEAAYVSALEFGKNEQWRDQHVSFEFVGLLQLQDLSGLESHEVWWELDEMVAPLERANEILPPKEHLFVFGGPPPKPDRAVVYPNDLLYHGTAGDHGTAG